VANCPGPEINNHFGVSKTSDFIRFFVYIGLILGDFQRFIAMSNFWWSIDIWILLGCIKIRNF
jgi:hypothetical protein